MVSRGFGQRWGHVRSYGNVLDDSAEGTQGNSNFIKQIPQLGFEYTTSTDPNLGLICITGIINNTLWFQYNTGTGAYDPQFGIQDTLTRDSVNKVFRHTDPLGRDTFFYDFSSSYAQGLRGKFKSFIDPIGNMTVPAYNASNQVTSFVRSSSTSSDGYFYDYYTSPDVNAGRIQYVTHQVNGTNIERTSSEYYGTSDTGGSLGDLKRVIAQQWQGAAWVTIGTIYYRYWKLGDPNGVKYGIKFVVGQEAYARMVAAGITPETATDTQLAGYADYYYEYDSSRRITREKTNGGTLTFDFTYTTSSFTPGTDPANRWQIKTVETLPNGAQNIVYSNFLGQTMLRVYKSGTSQWYKFYAYDASGNVILQAESSAVTGYDETKADLLNKVAGNYQYLSASSGLIYEFSYYQTTNLPAGAVAGMLAQEEVRQGTGGIGSVVRQYLYTSQPTGNPTLYLIWKFIEYQSDAAGGSNPATTVFDYTWYTDTYQMQQRTTTRPVVASSQNGSGTANSRVEYFDNYGQLIWVRDERGFLTNFTYDLSTGALTQRIDDVNTSVLSPPAGTGWTTPSGGGLHLITDYEIDSFGRTTQELGPSHSVDISGVATTVRRARWWVYLDSARTRYAGSGYATGTSPSYTYTLINPVSVIQQDNAGRVVEEITATRASTSGRLSASDTFAQTSWVRWRHFNYDNTGLLTFQRVYFLVPSSGSGTSGTNYNQTDFAYDSSGNRIKSKSPAGTIRRAVFDIRSKPIEAWMGTDDTGATPTNPAGSGAPNNMVKVSANQYDSGVAGGDGNLTQLTQYASAADTRVTTFTYDFRNRRASTDGEINFYEEYTYDNLNRLTQTDQKDTNGAGALVARSAIVYDNLGRIYQQLQYSVVSGVAGNSLKGKIWYNETGQVIKRVPQGTQYFEKAQFDGFGRVLKIFECFNTSELDTDYAAAGSVTGNTVLQQVENAYDATSNVIQVTTRQRFHDATGTGDLTTPGGAQPKARVSYQALYPDPIGRNQAQADYGTNAAASFTRSSTIPTRSDTVLVTSTGYNSRGEAYQTIDPLGTETRQAFDDANRRTQVIENYVSGGTNPDQNRETDYAYTADSQLSTLTAKNSVTGDQVTTYTYGTTLSDSDVASNDLLRYVQYPDGSATDRMEYKYNGLGQVKEIKDQLGSIRTEDYDKLGRLQHDRVTTLASGVGGAVLRLTQSYEVRGLLQNVTSYDNATVGSGSVVNDVQYAYDGFMLLTTEYQSHSGAVNTGTSPKVQYAYTDGSSNHARRTSITYPNAAVINWNYGTAGAADDVLNRVNQVKKETNVLADYSFLGVDQFVIATYTTQPGVELTYYTSGGSGDAGDQYTGLDRFGRVIDQRWRKTSTNADLERVKYGFDRANNRQWRQNTVAATGQDEYYTYDGLYQVKTLDRGTLNAGKTGISGTPSWEEDWNYDTLGNWRGTSSAYLTKVSGTTTLDQNRTHNVANEITAISTTTGTAWTTPTQNAVGNLTQTPQPLALGSGYDLKYDAWNRLVEVKATGGSVVATHGYDGVNRRVTKVIGANTRHYYYSDEWQVVEERLNASTSRDRQFIWGRRYVDDLICRDETGARLYVLHDYFNPTALIDTTGAVLERYGYDGFGTPRYMTASFGSRTASSYTWETLFGAYRYDVESGLYQVRNRYLHPKLGRWLSRDPIGYGGGINLYGYTENNPVSAVDPLGLDFKDWVLCIKLLGISKEDRKLIIKCLEDCTGKSGPDLTRCLTDCIKDQLGKKGIDKIAKIFCCAQLSGNGTWYPTADACKIKERAACSICCTFKDCVSLTKGEDPSAVRTQACLCEQDCMDKYPT